MDVIVVVIFKCIARFTYLLLMPKPNNYKEWPKTSNEPS